MVQEVGIESEFLCPCWFHGFSSKDKPVLIFLQYLIDANQKGLIFKASKNTVLVDSELSSSNSLSFWNLRQIKFELLVMMLIRHEFLVIFNCIKNKKMTIII